MSGSGGRRQSWQPPTGKIAAAETVRIVAIRGHCPGGRGQVHSGHGRPPPAASSDAASATACHQGPSRDKGWAAAAASSGELQIGHYLDREKEWGREIGPLPAFAADGRGRVCEVVESLPRWWLRGPKEACCRSEARLVWRRWPCRGLIWGREVGGRLCLVQEVVGGVACVFRVGGKGDDSNGNKASTLSSLAATFSFLLVVDTAA